MASLGETIKVKGIALREGISRNNVIYTASEMMKTALELADKPFLMDHESKSTNVIGKTTFAKYLVNEAAIYYEGWIKETGFGIVEAIKDGRINTVSIGAMCERLLEDEDTGKMIAEGIHYLELSTTPTPGVVGTSLMHSLGNMESGKMKAFNENVKLINKESATDTSKPLFSDSTQGIMPKDNTSRFKCPMDGCDYVCIGKFPELEQFAYHMMNTHQWSDSKADDYLRILGFTTPEEEAQDKNVDQSNNPGADIASKNEEPFKSVSQKGPYEANKLALTEEEKTEVQSLIFNKDKFDTTSAKKWAKDHDFKSVDVDVTDDSIRLRQKEPSQYKRFRTIDLDTGVKAVIGVKDTKEENKMVEVSEKTTIVDEAKKAKAEVTMPEPKQPGYDATKSEEEEMDDEEDETEENPVAYKSDDLGQKNYPAGAMPKPGKIARVAPYDKVSASAFDKKLQSRDLIIEKLSKEIDALKQAKEAPVQEKGLVNLKEVYSAGDKAYEASDLNLRFERSKTGNWSVWRMPKGLKGQLQ